MAPQNARTFIKSKPLAQTGQGDGFSPQCEPPIADADPQVTGAVRLAQWTGLGVTAVDVSNLRLVLMALLPNLAGLVLCFGLTLRNRPGAHPM